MTRLVSQPGRYTNAAVPTAASQMKITGQCFVSLSDLIVEVQATACECLKTNISTQRMLLMVWSVPLRSLYCFLTLRNAKRQSDKRILEATSSL